MRTRLGGKRSISSACQHLRGHSWATQKRATRARVICASLIIAQLQVAQGHDPSPRVLAEFDVHKNGNFLVLPVTIGERTHPFLLDTGSTVCLFDRTLRANLGREMRSTVAATAGDDSEVTLYEAPQFALGSIELRPNLGVVVTDLRRFSGVSGLNMRGSIGLDVLTDKVFTVDFDEGKLRFLDKAGVQHGAKAKLLWDRDEQGILGPYAIATVARTETPFLLDTGMWSFTTGSLNASRFDDLLARGELRRVPQADGVASVFGGDVRMAAGRLRSVSLEGFSHDNLLVERRRDDAIGSNSLGLGYISRYVVTFDFPNQCMYLRKGKHFDRRDRYSLGGMTLRREASHTIVSEMAANSVAAKAGIREGDELVRVDDAPVWAETLFDTLHRFAEPGTRRVVFVRDGKRHQATLRLVEGNDEYNPTDPIRAAAAPGAKPDDEEEGN